jgi:predicted DNA-binding transcriptional regulator AlpA
MSNILKDVDALLPLKAVEARYGVVSRTIDRWMEREDIGFPKPLKLNPRKRCWRVAELLEWERSRAMASGSEAA